MFDIVSPYHAEEKILSSSIGNSIRVRDN